MNFLPQIFTYLSLKVALIREICCQPVVKFDHLVTGKIDRFTVDKQSFFIDGLTILLLKNKYEMIKTD